MRTVNKTSNKHICSHEQVADFTLCLYTNRQNVLSEVNFTLTEQRWNLLIL